MIRILLWNLFLFCLPFVMLAGWLWLIRKMRPDRAEMKIWACAAVAGLVLMLGSLLYLRLSTDVATESIYVPPSLENGELVPGHFEEQP